MDIICHRIDPYNQNNPKIISKMIRNGYKSFEIDFQLCKDGVVLYHDHTLKQKGLKDKLVKYTIEELEAYDIYSIDALFSIIKTHEDISIFMDIKGHNEKIVGILYKKMIDFGNYSNIKFFIQSFNHYIIDLLKKFLGNKKGAIKYGYLITGFMNIYWDTYTKNIDYLCIDNEYIFKYYNKVDKPIYIYNCDCVPEINAPVEFIKGIITDCPDAFKIN